MSTIQKKKRDQKNLEKQKKPAKKYEEEEEDMGEGDYNSEPFSEEEEKQKIQQQQQQQQSVDYQKSINIQQSMAPQLASQVQQQQRLSHFQILKQNLEKGTTISAGENKFKKNEFLNNIKNFEEEMISSSHLNNQLFINAQQEQVRQIVNFLFTFNFLIGKKNIFLQQKFEHGPEYKQLLAKKKEYLPHLLFKEETTFNYSIVDAGQLADQAKIQYFKLVQELEDEKILKLYQENKSNTFYQNSAQLAMNEQRKKDKEYSTFFSLDANYLLNNIFTEDISEQLAMDLNEILEMTRLDESGQVVQTRVSEMFSEKCKSYISFYERLSTTKKLEAEDIQLKFVPFISNTSCFCAAIVHAGEIPLDVTIYRFKKELVLTKTVTQLAIGEPSVIVQQKPDVALIKIEEQFQPYKFMCGAEKFLKNQKEILKTMKMDSEQTINIIKLYSSAAVKYMQPCNQIFSPYAVIGTISKQVFYKGQRTAADGPMNLARQEFLKNEENYDQVKMATKNIDLNQNVTWTDNQTITYEEYLKEPTQQQQLTKTVEKELFEQASKKRLRQPEKVAEGEETKKRMKKSDYNQLNN